MLFNSAHEPYRFDLIRIRFRGDLFVDFPLSLQPVAEASPVQSPLGLPEIEGPCGDASLAWIGHDAHRKPKNDRIAITMTTRPTM